MNGILLTTKQQQKDKTRVDVQVQASLPSLALPSSQQGQALAARILPLPSEKIEMYILALKM